MNHPIEDSTWVIVERLQENGFLVEQLVDRSHE